MVKKQITKNGSTILRVKVLSSNIVRDITPRIDAEKKQFVWYDSHDSCAYAAIENGSFNDYWAWNMKDDVADDLKSADGGQHWELARIECGNGKERQVHYKPPRARFISEDDMNMSEWRFPICEKGSQKSIDAMIEEDAE